jgi:hypothetical protein
MGEPLQKYYLPLLDLNHTPNRGEFTAQNRAHPVYPIIAMPFPGMGPRATAAVKDHRPTIHSRNLVAWST